MNWWNRQKIQTKVTLSLAPAVIPMLIIVAVSYSSARDASLVATSRIGRLVMSDAADAVDAVVSASQVQFHEWIRDDIYGSSIEFDTVNELGDLFAGRLSSGSRFAGVLITDDEGRVLQAVGAGGAILGLEGQRVAEATSSASTAPRLIRSEVLGALGVDGDETFLFRHPTTGSSGEINGYLLGYVAWRPIEDAIEGAHTSLVDMGFPHAETILVTPDGIVLAGRSGDESRRLDLEDDLVAWLGTDAPASEMRRWKVDDARPFVAAAPTLAAIDGGGTALAMVPAADVLADARRTLLVSLGLAVAGAITLVGLIWFAGGRVAYPLERTAAILTDIAEGEGDLTRRIEVREQDEIGALAAGFNTFVSKLQRTMVDVASTTDAVSSAAQDLSRNAASMTEAAGETSTSASRVAEESDAVRGNVETMAAGIEELSASVREVATNAAEAAQVGQRAVTTATATNGTIQQLGESSARIGNVVKVITSIAEQTNLLALNATIEAARAGDAGKGFAVVANEVKDLANETARATEDIRQMIQAIQTDSEAAAVAIAEIVTIITQVNGLQNSIAGAVEEQSATTNEISRGVSDAAAGVRRIAEVATGLADAARGTSRGVGVTDAAARALLHIASRLDELVGQFRYADENGPEEEERRAA